MFGWQSGKFHNRRISNCSHFGAGTLAGDVDRFVQVAGVDQEIPAELLPRFGKGPSDYQPFSLTNATLVAVATGAAAKRPGTSASRAVRAAALSSRDSMFLFPGSRLSRRCKSAACISRFLRLAGLFARVQLIVVWECRQSTSTKKIIFSPVRQAAFKETALGFLNAKLKRAFVRNAGAGRSAQSSAKIGSGGMAK